MLTQRDGRQPTQASPIDAIGFPAAVLRAGTDGKIWIADRNTAFESLAPDGWLSTDRMALKDSLPQEVVSVIAKGIAQADRYSEPATLLVDGVTVGGPEEWTLSIGWSEWGDGYLLIVTRRAQPTSARPSVKDAETTWRENLQDVLTDSSVPSVCWVDHMGRVQEPGPALCVMLNEDTESLAGKPLQGIVAHRDWDAVDAAVREARNDQDIAPFTISLVGKGGDLIPVSFSPVAAGQGVLLALLDLRAYRNLVSEIAKAKDEAERSNQAKVTFLANMSHELRTPLNGIIGFSEIIRDEMLGPIGTDKYREYASDINFSAMHLVELLSDILDLARLESGSARLEETDCDLVEIFDEVAKLLRHATTGREITITHHVDGQVVVRADRRLIRQILVNLIYNSVKFSEPGAEVSLSVIALANGNTAVVVSDQGPGIPASMISEVLTPYRTFLPDEYGRDNRGTGLGLPLSKGLMELHGGSLLINSELGSGTSIFLVFPKERFISWDVLEDPDYREAQKQTFRYDVAKFQDLMETLTPRDLDNLPFGVIKLDKDGVVQAYSAAEGKFSGYRPEDVIGKNWFTEVAPCTALTEFQERFEEGMASGELDAFFDFVFEFPKRPMNAQIQMKPATDCDGAWVFVHWV